MMSVENLQPTDSSASIHQEQVYAGWPARQIYEDIDCLSHRAVQQPVIAPLDLGTEAALARLRLIAVFWEAWPAQTRRQWLQSQEISLPPCALSGQDIAILPGGALALRSPDAILVCDPAEAVTFSEAEMKALRATLRRRADATHLLHVHGGIVRAEQLPKVLPAQAVTIVQEAIRLTGRLTIPGPALVRWCRKGAVAWPLTEAPAGFSLAASIAATPVPRRGAPVAAEHWHAPDVESRCQLLGPCIAEHASDLLGDDLPDDMRCTIVDACVADGNSLTRSVAIGIAMLPVCFEADAAVCPGEPLAGWDRGAAHLQSAQHAQALLGLETRADSLSLIRGLRNFLEPSDALVLAEEGDPQHGGPVSLWDDAALFLGRRMQPCSRVGLILPVPATAVDLYALACKLSEQFAIVVNVSAPCWGFCHRIGPDGMEAGNAAWFGMGASLDEMEVLIGEIGIPG